MIKFIVELVQSGEKTRGQIIEEYNIPRNTLYRWLTKYEKKRTPNYKRIYTDLIKKWYPDRLDECGVFLKKERLEVLDVIELNEILFKQTKEINEINQKHRSYDKDTILWILNYQIKHGMNNTQLANHFKISRNTVVSWKKKNDF